MTAQGRGFEGVERRGLMFVLSSPSGAGKTTLSRMLIAETPDLQMALSAGQDVLFDIDWQGTQQLRGRSPNDVVSVFILPPSATALEQRLHTRAQASEEVIHGRMKKAGDEMSHFDAYDYIVVNDNIGLAFESVRSILRAEQLKRERQVGLADFVRQLRRQLEK